MLVFASVLSLVAVIIILLPFFVGSGGRLQAAASINSIEKLEAVKKSILKRYIEDERAYDAKRINRLAWDQRKQYLTNRYIDAARRLDYLRSLVNEQKEQGR